MAQDTALDNFLRVFQNILNDTVRALNNDDVSLDVTEVSINRLNALWRNIGRISTSYPQCVQLSEDLQSLIRCIENMKM